jgi:hypothetical protein
MATQESCRAILDNCIEMLLADGFPSTESVGDLFVAQGLLMINNKKRMIEARDQIDARIKALFSFAGYDA